MDEQVFLNDPGLLVTSSRIEIGGQTFATRNVGSVKLTAPGTSRVAVLLAILGVPVALSQPIVGVAMVVLCAMWAYGSSRRRELRMVAGGGEVLALSTSDAALAERARSAIASAIATR